MPQLLEGKLALILGIANKWSMAYAIAQAFSREGATLVLTYLGEHQKEVGHLARRAIFASRKLFPATSLTGRSTARQAGVAANTSPVPTLP